LGIPSGFCSVSASAHAHDGRTHVRAVQASTAISGEIMSSMSDSGQCLLNTGLKDVGVLWLLNFTSPAKWSKYDMHLGSFSSGADGKP
jgi:hypothetical protein